MHYERCEPYRNIVNRIFGGPRALDFDRLEDAPYVGELLDAVLGQSDVVANADGSVKKTLTARVGTTTGLVTMRS